MRALARWGITPFLAAPLGAWALGLGDIELQSALNQPFKAEIALVSATPEEVQGLRIALAPRETFEQRGLDRADFLSTLEFRVAKDSAGRDVVRVTSREPITEPFVTMLVDATWARGRLLREYTVLLDPPVLLPEPAAPIAVQPPQSRAPAPNAQGGAINRQAPAPAPAPAPQRTPAPAVAPAPVRQPTQGPTSNAAPPPRAPTQPSASNASGSNYGPVQRSETLWKIAEQFKPADISMNQMMVAVYQANPRAFRGNMNLLQVGAVLQIPDAATLQALGRGEATAEVQRQTDVWQGRPPQQARLILVPPAGANGGAANAPAPAAAAANNAPAPQAPAATQTPAAAATAAAEENRRLLEVRDEQLRNLQEQTRAAETPVAEAVPPAAPPAAAAPGVDIESEQIFTDEAQAPEAVAPAPAAEATAPRTIVVEPQSSFVSQALGWLATPLLWIVLGAAALILGGLWFVRRRREAPEDSTGRWQELDSAREDEAREDTERLRRKVQDQSFVVEETARPPRLAELDVDLDDEPTAEATLTTPRAGKPVVEEDTLSSQTVINLDQADPVAEADFHMAYGLYDQAAELVSKALQAAPNRRDLKLKLLEVFFVWGNKDAFLNAAKGLRKEIGDRPDADWDKVVIMGKQICPEAPLFAEATVGAGMVDVNLESGTSPALDFAFEETGNRKASGMDFDLTGGADIDDGGLEIETSAERRANQARKAARSNDSSDSLLDIGERTAAGLEALFFEEEDPATKTTPDIDIDTHIDELEVTQESPTVETPRSKDRGRPSADSPTAEYSAFETPTIETPTIESAGSEAPTMETPTIETPRHRDESRDVDPFAGNLSDRTAEIDLDDLGLDIKDLEDLPGDLGDLRSADDTRDQPGIGLDDELLSATGVTQVLRFEDEFERKTGLLSDEDATMLSPSEVDTLRGTEVLEHRFEFDESGDTSLVKALRRDDGLDLNLDDLSAALQGSGDTVEQPRSSSFSGDVFGGKNSQTPIDMDIGLDISGPDDPTGTEDASQLDPQTMTEVGTKLDLARAYIDMGDPEGARSILEEVLDEGDPVQRREAQTLIDVLAS